MDNGWQWGGGSGSRKWRGITYPLSVNCFYFLSVCLNIRVPKCLCAEWNAIKPLKNLKLRQHICRFFCLTLGQTFEKFTHTHRRRRKEGCRLPINIESNNCDDDWLLFFVDSIATTTTSGGVKNIAGREEVTKTKPLACSANNRPQKRP